MLSFQRWSAAVLLAFVAATPAVAQTYAYSIYVDSDNNAASGCGVSLPGGAVSGAESVLTATVDAGSPPTVAQVTRATCVGGSFGAPTTFGTAAIGVGAGTGGTTAIELGGALAGIAPGATVLRLYVVGQSASGSDVLLTTSGASAGAPILLALNAQSTVPAPSIGIPAILLLGFGLLLFGSRAVRRRLLKHALLGLAFVSGIAGAAIFNWNGVAPLASDPAGDATSGEVAIDLRTFFAVFSGGNLQFRIDVSGALAVPPAPAADSYTTPFGTVLTVPAPGVLGNDTLNSATITTNTNPSHGSLTLNADGSFTYTPASGYAGGDSFTYTLHNGGGDSIATVSLMVGSNHVPSFTKGANPSELEDATAQNIAGWAMSISDGDDGTQTLDFQITTDNDALFATLPAISPAGTLTYESAANANGTATVTVKLHDNGGTMNGGVDASAAQTFTITVTAVNDVPSFTKGADENVLEDSGAYLVPNWATNLVAGPADESGQTLSFLVSNDNAALFTVPPAIAANGTLTYTLANGQKGTATVSVQIHDDGGTANTGVDTSATQTFMIVLAPVNHAPSFIKGTDRTVLEDAAAQNIPGWATSIVDNDGNTQVLDFIVTNDNNALFATQPAISPTGVLTYALAANANGTALVTMKLHDDGGTANGGADTSAAQTFTITVTAVNDAPSFTGGTTASVLESSGAATFANFNTAISPGPSNESAQTLVFDVSVSGTAGNLTFSIAPAISPSGTLTFTPTNGTYGSATVSMSLKDDGGTADSGVDTSAAQTFTITVNNVNDPPVFSVGGTQTALEDAGMRTTPGFLTGIADGDDGTQTIVFNITNNTNPPLFSAGPAISSNGTLTYTPAANANGTATITVLAQDNGGTLNGGNDTSAAQTFVIDITAVNDAPSFTPGSNVNVIEDSGAASISWASAISAGPADEAGQTLTFSANVTSGAALFSTPPAISSSGVLSFTPAANASGAASVTITLVDNGGTVGGGADTSAPHTLTIAIAPVDDAPVAADDSASVIEDAPAGAINVFANDTDIDGGPISIDAVTQPANGTVAITGGGAGLTYQPNANYCNAPPGTALDTFTYTLAPGGSSATVSVAVTCVDDAPTAVGDAITITEDDPATAIPVLVNDTDIDGGPKSVGSVTQPANGTVVITGGGTGLSYQPNANYCNSATGTTDDFTYTLTPGGSVATVKVTVTCVVDDPAAVNDAATVVEDAAATPVNVLGNDQNPDGATITVASVTQPVNGVVVITGGGSGLTYQPNPNYCNTPPGTTLDTFTYTLDPAGATPTATVAMTVTCVDDAPVAVDDAISVLEDAAATAVPVLANDTDVDGGPKSVASITQPVNGTVVITGGGTGLTYKPNANYCNNPPGTTLDTFTYTLTPGGSSATVKVTVTCVNDAPTVAPPANIPVHTNIAMNVADGASGDLLVAANISDPDSSSFTIGSAPTTSANGGELAINMATGAFTYNPPGGFTGNDTFQYTVCDNGTPQACSAAVTATLVVSGPRIFFVDDDAVVVGTRDGTLQQPFQTLAAAVAVATTAGDKIFLFSGNYTGGVTLPNGVELAGQALDATTVNDFDSELGITPPSNSIARPLVDQAPPVITNASGNGITLGSNNTVRGVQIGNTTGAAIGGSNFGTLKVYDDVRINTNGTALSLNSGTVDPSSLIATMTSSGGINNVSLMTVAGSLSVGAGALSGASGAALSVNLGTGSFSYGGSINKASTGLLIDLKNKPSGTITLSGALGATAGTGISVTNSGASLLSSGVVTLNGGDAGIDVTGGSSGTITFSNTGSSITNPTNEAVTISASSPNFTYAGSITKNTGTGIRSISNTGGTQTFSGSVTVSSGTANAITVSGNGTTTINFTGPLGLDTTGGDAFAYGISGTVNVSGGLIVMTANGDGIHATGGGPLTITAPGSVANMITTTGNGRSISLVSTKIGAAGLTFRKITSTAAGAIGITLSNTGTGAGFGGLTVTGTGTTGGSGGTISKKSNKGVSTSGGVNGLSLSNMLFIDNGTDQDPSATCGDALNGTNTNCGAAIDLQATNNVVLSRTTVTLGKQIGINGNDVNGLTMDNVAVTGVGDGNLEDGVQLVNLRGTVNISNSIFRDNYHRQFEVQNPSASSALTMTLDNDTFDRTSYGTSVSAQGVLIAGNGNSVMTTTINNSKFKNNWATALTAQGIGNAQMTFNVGTAGANTFTDNSLAFQFLTDNAATMNADVQGNTITVSAAVTAGSTPVTFRKGTDATGLFVGSFTNNTIGNGTVNSGNNCNGCNGVSITNEGASGGMKMTVSNNTVQNVRQRAVEFLGQQDDTAGVVITNNQFLSPDPPVPAGTRNASAIFAQSGTDDTDGSQLCADIQGNTIGGNWDDTGFIGNIRIRLFPVETGGTPGVDRANFRLRNVGGTGTAADAKTYLDGVNSNAQSTATVNGVTNFTTGTAACF